MPRDSSQKLKLFYLYQILSEHTDEEHPMPMKEIISRLSALGVQAERKSVYSDMETLRFAGVDIIATQGKYAAYYMGERDFELPELKLLVDSVQASRFLTEKKSNQLIRKLEKLTSRHYAHELQRYVYTAERAKTLNEEIYYGVDRLHEAMTDAKKVSFLYYDYTPKKKKEPRNGGAPYIVSPYSLSWSDDNYYLIAHHPKYDSLSHFRVDRMSDIRILKEDALPIADVMGRKFNLGEYSKKTFQMFAGETVTVQLLCENGLANAVIDRFGEGIRMRPENDTHFVATAQVNISPPFFAWLFTFGNRIKITSPSDVAQKYQEHLKMTLDGYEG